MAVPTLTESLDNLYTTTWQNMKGEVADNIFDASPFWFWMKSNGRFKTEEGGRFLTGPLQYSASDGVSWITKGGAVSLNDFEFLTIAKDDWRYLVGNVVRFGVDDHQNRGKNQIINYMTAKLNNVQNSLVDELETQLFSAQSGNTMNGLADLIGTSANTVHGIAESTYTWFAPNRTTMTGLSFSVYGLSYMSTMLRSCMNNLRMDQPDILVTTSEIYGYYEDETMEQKQIVNKKLGDAGFTSLEYKGVPIIWSPAATADAMYFLNTRYLYFTYDPALYFDMTEWKPIPDQVNDRAAQIVTACNMMVSRRLCQGILHTIDTA